MNKYRKGDKVRVKQNNVMASIASGNGGLRKVVPGDVVEVDEANIDTAGHPRIFFRTGIGESRNYLPESDVELVSESRSHPVAIKSGDKVRLLPHPDKGYEGPRSFFRMGKDGKDVIIPDGTEVEVLDADQMSIYFSWPTAHARLVTSIKYVELVADSDAPPAPPHKCNCPWEIVLHEGCKCGGI